MISWLCLITLRISSISAIDHALWLHKTLKKPQIFQTLSCSLLGLGHMTFLVLVFLVSHQRLSFSKHGTGQLCPRMKTYSYDSCLSLVTCPRLVVF